MVVFDLLHAIGFSIHDGQEAAVFLVMVITGLAVVGTVMLPALARPSASGAGGAIGRSVISGR
jgi:hypothetical protein